MFLRAFDYSYTCKHVQSQPPAGFKLSASSAKSHVISCSDDVNPSYIYTRVTFVCVCVWSGARSNVRSGVGVCVCVSVCVHACVCLSYSFSSSLSIGSNYAVALIVIQPAVGELRTRTEEGERVRCGVR